MQHVLLPKGIWNSLGCFQWTSWALSHPDKWYLTMSVEHSQIACTAVWEFAFGHPSFNLPVVWLTDLENSLFLGDMEDICHGCNNISTSALGPCLVQLQCYTMCYEWDSGFPGVSLGSSERQKKALEMLDFIMKCVMWAWAQWQQTELLVTGNWTSQPGTTNRTVLSLSAHWNVNSELAAFKPLYFLEYVNTSAEIPMFPQLDLKYSF